MHYYIELITGDIYFTCRYILNVTTQKWRVQNLLIKVFFFVVNFRSYTAITVNVYVKVEV